MKSLFHSLQTHRSRLTVAIMLLTAAGCGNSGGMSHYEQVKLTQQEAADAIAAHGGTAVEKRYPQGDAWIVDLSGQAIDDKVIRHLQTLRQVSELDLSGSTITDQQLAVLAVPQPLGTTIKLNISDTQVSDAGFMALAELHLLYEINVKGSQVTPAGIERYRSSRPKHPFGVAITIVK